MVLKNNLILYLLEKLTILVFTIYFFLWSQSLSTFDERLLLILLIPIYLIKKNEPLNKLLSIYFLVIILFISLHLLLNNFLFEYSLSNNFQAVIGTLLIALIVILYRSFLLNNLHKIIYFFLGILFLFFTIENIIFDNFYNYSNFDCYDGWFSNVKLKIFSENSHFGMMAPAVISYLIFMEIKNNKIKYLNILLITFLFLFISTTMLVGTVICLFFILILKFKFINNFQKILSILVFLTSLVLIISKPQCNMRLSETIEGLYINFKSRYLNDPNIKEVWKIDLENGSLNQSSEVVLNSYDVSVKSIKYYPLGTGINNYNFSYNKFSSDLSFATWDVNKEDGSNNFSKIITEFGIFGFVLFLYIFLNFFKHNKNLNINFFFYSIVLTQLLRGSGYFNGGFLLSIFIILSLIFIKDENAQISKK